MKRKPSCTLLFNTALDCRRKSSTHRAHVPHSLKMVTEYVCFADGRLLLVAAWPAWKKKTCTHYPEYCGNGEQQQRDTLKKYKMGMSLLLAVWFSKLNTAFFPSCLVSFGRYFFHKPVWSPLNSFMLRDLHPGMLQKSSWREELTPFLSKCLMTIRSQS